MQRQRQHPLAQRRCHGAEIPGQAGNDVLPVTLNDVLSVTPDLIGGLVKRRLPVQRLRVIDHRRDTIGLEGGLDGIALLARSETDGILRPTGAVTRRNDRRRQPLQEFRVAGGNLIHGIQLVFGERLELHLQDRRLDRIQPGVQADTDIVILERPFPVHPVRGDQRRPFVIVREHGATVSVAAQWLGGEERSRRDIAETAGSEIPGQAGNDVPVMADLIGHLNSSAETLRPIFQDQEPIAVGHRPDRLIISREAEQVHGNDNAGTQPSFRQDFLHRTLQISGIDVERLLANIYENRLSAFKRHDLGRREECEVRDEHGITGSDAPSLESQGEGIRPVRTGQTMLDPDVFRQLLFQRPNLRAHDIGAGRHRVQDGPVHFLAEDLILLLEISKFHGFANARRIEKQATR